MSVALVKLAPQKNLMAIDGRDNFFVKSIASNKKRLMAARTIWRSCDGDRKTNWEIIGEHTVMINSAINSQPLSGSPGQSIITISDCDISLCLLSTLMITEMLSSTRSAVSTNQICTLVSRKNSKKFAKNMIWRVFWKKVNECRGFIGVERILDQNELLWILQERS